MSKPSLAKGTRDFGPEETAKRKFIFNTIEQVFRSFSFDAIETPAIENLSTLTGKYGEEGDTLLFKILDSGDFLNDARNNIAAQTSLHQLQSHELAPYITSRGLRYDLTVPFARFVAMNRHRISIPFRRYQMQPVWRADRPQKGRYREFWQCDADIIGSESMLNEADLMSIFHQAFHHLGIQGYEIHINNRKVLEGMAEKIGMKDHFQILTIALDKYDKIGWEGVKNELIEKGFEESQITGLKELLKSSPLSLEDISLWKNLLANHSIGLQGLQELEQLTKYLIASNSLSNIVFDSTLARGLSYYTGCIFEVKVPESGIGSIAAGGRYDNLTGIFGMPGLSGVGISFGADRIYDLMEAHKLFPNNLMGANKVLFCPLDEESIQYCLPIAQMLRNQDIPCMVYPVSAKIKKQLDYANSLKVNYVVLVGESERTSGKVTLKNLTSGQQGFFNQTELIKAIQHDF